MVEKAVLTHLAERIFTDETCKEILRHVSEESGYFRQRVHDERRELERQLAETEKKLARWYAAFESGEMSDDVGKDRVSELKADRDRLVETLAKVVPIKPVPAHVYQDETIWKFQAALRRLFTSGDEGLAKHYMRFLIDRIAVNGTAVEIKAKATSAVALMARAGDSSGAVLTADDAVLTHGGDWLRVRRCLRTLSVNAFGTDSYLRTDPRRRSRCDSENLRRERWDRFADSLCPIVSRSPRDRAPSGHVEQERAVPTPAGL